MGSMYYFYMGSLTSPPCSEHVYHLIFSKPIKISTCQFKVLRENSLLTEGKRLIHARIAQDNKPHSFKMTKKGTMKGTIDSPPHVFAIDKFERDPDVRLFIPILLGSEQVSQEQRRLIAMREKEEKERQMAKNC